MAGHIRSWLTLFTLVCIAFIATLATPCRADEPQVFTFRPPGTTTDHRFDYEIELLRLVLDTTLAEYGPYQLRPGFTMNLPRAMAIARGDSLDNLVLKTSYSKALADEFYYAAFPIDRGIFSYRICFVNDAKVKAVSEADTLEKIRQFTIGQGVGWLDVSILQHNGFTVAETPKYENLFPMVAAGRVDLVCRGLSEIQPEWDNFRDLGGFSVDRSFALYYPLPRFMWIHKSRPQAFNRIRRGLEIVYNDGSARELWEKHYRKKLDFVSLKNRRIFMLTNPFLEDISEEYKPYFLTRPAIEN